MIDHHCHILPGLDDGCRTQEESVAMARALVASGFSHIYCTPHCITGLYDLTHEQVREAVKVLQGKLDCEGIPLRLQTGMEYYLDDFFNDRFTNLMPLGNSDLLLFELPSAGDVDVLPEVVCRIKSQGLKPLLAHPERFLARNQQSQGMVDFAQRWFNLLTSKDSSVSGLPPAFSEAVAQGCLLQADLGSFNGLYGQRAQRWALWLKEQQLYFCVGSDGHRPNQLEKILSGNIWLDEERGETAQEISCGTRVGVA